MKEYKEKEYRLGFFIKEFKNDKHYYYNLDYNPHGFYLSVYFFNNIIYSCKGYYNMSIKYSHWLDNYHSKYNYQYYI